MELLDYVSKYVNYTYKPMLVDLNASHGSYLACKHSNKKFLDCCSYFASSPVGYNHPRLSDPAFEFKLLSAAKVKPCNGDFLTEEFSSFLQTFMKIAAPRGYNNVFFIEGGAAAVENALKAAFDWKFRQLLSRGDRGVQPVLPEDLQIAHLCKSFHGRSGYTMSVTNSSDARKTKYFPAFRWLRCESPAKDYNIYNSFDELAIQNHEFELGQLEDTVVDSIRNAKNIAGILIEPIQSEGGDRYFRPQFHAKLRQVANECEALLIYDEIQTGIGSTGTMWAFEHYGVQPDIICFGKKLQVCGFASNDRVRQVKGNVFEEKGRLDSTWNGSLVDMVRGEMFLKIIKEDGLLKNTAVVGSYLKDCLLNLSLQRGAFTISAARGVGLMCAFDLPSKEARDSVVKTCFDNQLLVLQCGERSIRLRPPLTFSKAEVDELIIKLSKSLG